jgi:hypothetical protein
MSPTTFPCPFCSKKMGVGPELLGRKVRCPNCKEVLVAPAPAPAEPPPVSAVPPPPPIAPPPPPISSTLPRGWTFCSAHGSTHLPVTASHGTLRQNSDSIVDIDGIPAAPTMLARPRARGREFLRDDSITPQKAAIVAVWR